MSTDELVERRDAPLAAAAPTPRIAAVLAQAGSHWPLLVVLALAAAVRVAAQATYAPALMWADSWQYLFGTDLPGAFLPDKPNGYVLFLRAMGVGAHLSAITLVQHVLGVAGGVLLYVLLRRLGCGRLLASCATAIVVLDAYAIALEQHVLAEAHFTFVLVAFAFVAVALPRAPALAALAGSLLVVAVAVRAAAIFVVPIWIAFALWHYRSWWARGAAIATVAVGLAGYVAWHDAKAGGLGFNQMAGWQLYGRVAEIGDCPGRSVTAEDRSLCPAESNRPEGWNDSYAYALFSPSSPVQRELGDLYGLPTQQRLDADARLRAFARDVILDRPLAFVGIVARDTARYFVPGEMAALPSFDEAVTFPHWPRPVSPAARAAQQTFALDYRPPPDARARLLPAYGRWVHTPRWLLGVLLLASIVALGANLVPRLRGRVAHAPEILLLSGAGFALVAGSALNHFEPRFLIPAVPLLVAGGAIAVAALATAIRRARTTRRATWRSERQGGGSSVSEPHQEAKT